ncbi:intraflagellar transport 122 [Baffinella frigidus]|nr:intraflagellar transport 122 [Cryptophyta sp. CCMP2293]
MRAVLAWQADNQNKEGAPGPCMSVCFNPEGTQQLVAAVGTLVLVFNASDGSLVHRLKGHKDNVYAVSYSKDGKRFSSGGADKSVIIWQSNGEGILKYSHNDTIQCVEYNPVTLELASATASDFGIWSPDQKSVSKHKIAAKATSLSWTSDGQLLAIGQFDGCVSVRQKDGVEKRETLRSEILTCDLAWDRTGRTFSRWDGEDILSVGCWDGTLSFFSLAPKQLGKDKTLGYDPCCARYFGNGEYLVLAGSDNKATLWTKDGVQLQTICERADWIWAVAPRPKQNYVAVGCNDGSVAVYQLNFSTVHGLYQDRYAYRDFMTNVTIQHLTTEQKVRIKTKDHVKKIAVYRERLAVQLPDRVLIYELREGGEENDMHYVKRNTVQRAVECNLLVVTSFHIILCQEKKLQLLDFQGVKEREWVLDAVIRYIKVVGGPPGREGLMVGLKDGQVLKIFVDNPFPIHVIKHERAIRCLDLSCMRRKLAVVDEAANVVVYDVMTGERVFEDQNANSVAWNSVLEEQLCYSGKDQLCIKTGDFPIHRERMQGFVVGVRASKVFCLHYLAMNTLYVPQSAAMFRYLERKDFGSAYRLATMGVTDTDWIALAQEALLAMDLDVALKAFIRVRDVRFTELINRVRASRKLTGHDDQVLSRSLPQFLFKIFKKYVVMVKAGRVDLAIKMFSDLKRWDDARFIAGTV